MIATRTYEGPDRRRSDVTGLVTRATFPVREAARDFLEGFPCNVVGHHWTEVPRGLQSRRERHSGRMRFKCSRCYLTGGFSN